MVDTVSNVSLLLYEFTISHLCILCILCILYLYPLYPISVSSVSSVSSVCIQVKIDVAQLKEQETLRMQLQQEQDLLQTFQEAQDEKLRVQHERERAALQEKVELSKRELDKEVSQQRVRERFFGLGDSFIELEEGEGRLH